MTWCCLVSGLGSRPVSKQQQQRQGDGKLAPMIPSLGLEAVYLAKASKIGPGYRPDGAVPATGAGTGVNAAGVCACTMCRHEMFCCAVLCMHALLVSMLVLALAMTMTLLCPRVNNRCRGGFEASAHERQAA